MCSLHQVNESRTRGRRLKTKSLRRYTFLLTCVLIFGDAVHLFGANMRSFIEAVRRKAPVVYVGSVKEVRLLQRTKFDIKAKAIVDIKVCDANSGEQFSAGDYRVFKLRREDANAGGWSSISTATWRFRDRFCQLLRRQHSAWISRAGEPPGVAAAGRSFTRCS